MQSPANYFDLAYTFAGLLVVVWVWATYSDDAAFKIAMLMLLTYCAGRVAGTHRPESL